MISTRSIPTTRQAVKRFPIDNGKPIMLAGILIRWDQHRGGEIIRKCPKCQRAGRVSVLSGQEKLIEAIHYVSDRHWTCIRCQREREEQERHWLAYPAGW